MFVIMIKNKHRKTHQLCIISFTALLLFNACSAQFSKINKTENASVCLRKNLRIW